MRDGAEREGEWQLAGESPDRTGDGGRVVAAATQFGASGARRGGRARRRVSHAARAVRVLGRRAGREGRAGRPREGLRPGRPRDASVPYTADMVSCIGSVTKQFTAAADPGARDGREAGDHRPDFEVPAGRAARQGGHHHPSPAHPHGRVRGRPRAAATRNRSGATRSSRRCWRAPLASRPGERFEVLERGLQPRGRHRRAGVGDRVRGVPARARSAARRPEGHGLPGAGLAARRACRSATRPTGRPWGRVYKNGWLPDGPGWYLRGNGGIQSTLADLYRWHLALEAGKVLSADAVQRFQTGHVASTGSRAIRLRLGRADDAAWHEGGHAQRRQRVHLQRCQALPRREGGHHRDEQPADRFQPRSWRPASSSRWCSATPQVVMPPVPVEVPRRHAGGAGRALRAGRGRRRRGATVTVRATADGLEAESGRPGTARRPRYHDRAGRPVRRPRVADARHPRAGGEGQLPADLRGVQRRPAVRDGAGQPAQASGAGGGPSSASSSGWSCWGPESAQGDPGGDRAAALRTRRTDPPAHLGAAPAGRIPRRCRRRRSRSSPSRRRAGSTTATALPRSCGSRSATAAR